MKATDIVTMKMTTQGAEQVQADLAAVKQKIHELKQINETLTQSIKQKAGEIEVAQNELNKYTNAINKQEKSILKIEKANIQLIERLSQLNKLGQEDTKQYEKYNSELQENDKKLKEIRKEMELLSNSQYAAAENLDRLKTLQKGYKNELRENNKEIHKQNDLQKDAENSLPLRFKSYNQLIKQQRQLKNELNNTNKELEPEKWNRLLKQLGEVDTQLKKVAIGSRNVSKGFSVMGVGIGTLVGNLATKALGYLKNLISDAKDFVKEGINMAKSARGVIDEFNKLSDSKRYLKEMRQATRDTISELNLMEKTIRAKELGIPIQHMASLMAYARQQAVKLKKDVNYMSDSIVDGLGRKSTLILDNLGISSTRVQAEIKKTGDFTQAVMNIIDESLKKQGNTALNEADKAAQAAAKWENTQLKVGKAFSSVGSAWDKMSGKIADGISDLIGETDSLTQQYNNQIDKVADLELNTKPLIKRYEELKSKSTLTKDEQTELNSIIKTIAGTIPEAVTEIDKYGNALGINAEKAYAFIEAQKALLKYKNKDAIEETESDIEKYKKKIEHLNALRKNGKLVTTFWEGTHVKAVEGKELEKLMKDIDETKELLLGAENQLKQINGTTIDEQLKTTKTLKETRTKFNNMNKKELDIWIKNEKNAASEYLELAKKTYDERFGTNPEKTDSDKTVVNRQKNLLSQKETELDTALKKELQLLKDNKINEKQTEEEYNIKVAEKQSEYYDKRIAMYEDFKKKEKIVDKKFSGEIDEKIIDAKGKKQDIDPIVDNAHLTTLKKQKDKELAFSEAVMLGQIKHLQTLNLSEEEYAARMETIELMAAQRRVTINKKYNDKLTETVISNELLKQEAVEESNIIILQSEIDAANQRIALEKKMRDTNRSVRDSYGISTKEDRLNEEIAIMDALLAAKQITAETHQKALLAIYKKYEDETLQIKQQYGIAGVKELYNAELEELRIKYDQELLTTEEYEAAKGQLKLKYATQFAQQIAQLTGNAVSMVSALQQAETANLDAEYDARIAAAQGNAEEVERLENEKAQKKLDIEKKYADVQFAVKASDIIANTAVAIMTGYAQLGPIMGSIAAAMLGVTGAAQLAIANAERNRVKNMTLDGSSSGSGFSGSITAKGKEEGGYMDVTREQDGKRFSAEYEPDKRGYINRPTVIVGEGPTGQSKEWIANNALVNNPTARPIIDLFDAVQRAPNVATIDMNRLIRSRMAGFESGGFPSGQMAARVGGSPVIVSPPSDPIDMALQKRLIDAIEKLNAKQLVTNLGMSELDAKYQQYLKDQQRFTKKDS